MGFEIAIHAQPKMYMHELHPKLKTHLPKTEATAATWEKSAIESELRLKLVEKYRSQLIYTHLFFGVNKIKSCFSHFHNDKI